MRHNQNGRRYRGRGGGQNHHHNSHSGGGGGGGGGQRRINPRVHTFDSNGPDVRIRGNAYQITEKYQALAKDAAAAGDRVLAESYLQHAEHYQRLINELGDEYSRHQQQQGGHHHHNNSQQQQSADNAPNGAADPAEAEQPVIQGDGLADLDPGFLVGPRRGRNRAAAAAETAPGEGEQPAVAVEPRQRTVKAAE
jgi:hypothetical protein